ncbi:AAA family ATPase [Goodfellowiella coeruleoviolacea]|uniref:ATPase n=1 Tax=Goodfellowiella coeruleoviolacea TaxID=334858 RepID=A0AAE3KIT6_9PSEU|nr:AAA family ATPase [Goodfellowiella coeruleoviolacea]MCP2169596.1 putative ATPase [Goodfellowiella coeruleoviolacea]
MPTEPTRLVVLTGGPGSGKSTVIDRLRQAGFACSAEAGRAIIRDQVAIDGPALPWRDHGLFAELMLCWELRSYRLAEARAGTVFFDRGLPDVVGYLRVAGRPVPEHIRVAAQRFRYHRRVFVAPPWPEIYARDTERGQSFAEAVRTHESMVETYSEFGYELVPLPLSSVEDRVRFVTEQVGARPAQ